MEHRGNGPILGRRVRDTGQGAQQCGVLTLDQTPDVADTRSHHHHVHNRGIHHVHNRGIHYIHDCGVDASLTAPMGSARRSRTVRELVAGGCCEG